LTRADVERIAIGAGILGTGGGGNPYRGMIQARLQLEAGRRLDIVRLDELPDDALVVPLGGMGAPTVGLEKIGRGDEGKRAVEMLCDYLGVAVAATIPIEVGGSNSFVPLIAAAQLGLPTVDADGMGRAFPEWSMISYYFDGVAPSPVLMTDSQDRKIILEQVATPQELERIGRAVCVQLGGRAMVADRPIPVRRLRKIAIPGTLSLAHRIGDAVLAAQRQGADPIRAVCDVAGGGVLFGGKISDVDRRFERGYNIGQLTLTGTGAWQGQVATIDLQNEFLLFAIDGQVRTIVPDLICMVDSERGTPFTTEVVRYGLRATVLGIPAPPQLTTPQALRAVGPQAFGYDLPYTSLQRHSP
ncbi:MAG TPA: DUF917 domain-containing protein, partial [Roseiflexaceae bacterium]|nr:DUF917 domain-containing protein [Roseiflexaceae bacterium]